jgi:hypothetical protein
VIAGSSTETGLEEYLTLLSICQTCKYMGVDFLDFTRSGEKDIHAFAESRPRRRRRLGHDSLVAATSTAPKDSDSHPAGGNGADTSSARDCMAETIGKT